MTTQALQGVRVLEVGQLLAGPLRAQSSGTLVPTL